MAAFQRESPSPRHPMIGDACRARHGEVDNEHALPKGGLWPDFSTLSERGSHCKEADRRCKDTLSLDGMTRLEDLKSQHRSSSPQSSSSSSSLHMAVPMSFMLSVLPPNINRIPTAGLPTSPPLLALQSPSTTSAPRPSTAGTSNQALA